MKSDIKCPECESSNIVNNGVRNTKKGDIQKYKCKDCGRIFSFSSLKNKGYDAKIILASLSYYNLGNTLEKTSSYINRRYKIKTSPQTVHNWVKENKSLCSFIRFRNKDIVKDKLIFSKMFSHEQPYLFRYNRFKLSALVNDYFKGLKDYLAGVPYNCPDKLFVSENLRSSKFRVDKECLKRVKIVKSKNYACKLVCLALKACSSNKERHNIVQEFMLLNDSATLACEVPVWINSSEIKKDPILSSIIKIDSDITGHIDIVQNKFGFIHILDYKPDADYEDISKVVSQLFVYAAALSLRTGIWLRNIRCAWFDDLHYFEFNPNLIVIDYLKKNNIKDNSVWRKYWVDYAKHEWAVKINKKMNIAKAVMIDINRRFDKKINRLSTAFLIKLSTADLIRIINRVFDFFNWVFGFFGAGDAWKLGKERLNGL